MNAPRLRRALRAAGHHLEDQGRTQTERFQEILGKDVKLPKSASPFP